ncbi:MAG: hypothetical protein MNPFHGCM_00702 [Gemmatimonadaceae bacterium]|nr:hypothetical protein [Gemmatimonadaceae bacterium]
MTESVRVYVNARPIDAPARSTALDAVRVLDPVLAEDVAGGTRAITDSRGLPLDTTTPLVAGTILRVVSVRSAGAE